MMAGVGLGRADHPTRIAIAVQVLGQQRVGEIAFMVESHQLAGPIADDQSQAGVKFQRLGQALPAVLELSTKQRT